MKIHDEQCQITQAERYGWNSTGQPICTCNSVNYITHTKMQNKKVVEFIVNELSSVINIPVGIEEDNSGGYRQMLLKTVPVSVVDVNKLAIFLAKHLKVSAEELLSD